MKNVDPIKVLETKFDHQVKILNYKEQQEIRREKRKMTYTKFLYGLKADHENLQLKNSLTRIQAAAAFRTKMPNTTPRKRRRN